MPRATGQYRALGLVGGDVEPCHTAFRHMHGKSAELVTHCQVHRDAFLVVIEAARQSCVLLHDEAD